MRFLGGDDACKHNYSTYTKGNKKSMLPYLTNLSFLVISVISWKEGRDLKYVLFFRESGAKLFYI